MSITFTVWGQLHIGMLSKQRYRYRCESESPVINSLCQLCRPFFYEWLIVTNFTNKTESIKRVLNPQNNSKSRNSKQQNKTKTMFDCLLLEFARSCYCRLDSQTAHTRAHYRTHTQTDTLWHTPNWYAWEQSECESTQRRRSLVRHARHFSTLRSLSLFTLPNIWWWPQNRALFMLCCSAFSEYRSVCVRVFICNVFECICTMPTVDLMHLRVCLCGEFAIVLRFWVMIELSGTTWCITHHW